MDDDQLIDEEQGDAMARYELLLDVTLDTLRSDPELRLCEGLRLIEAARTAVGRLAPSAVDNFESTVLPQMKEALMERFGITSLPVEPCN
ncbi:MAG: hypothetical protein GY906_20260 [bacterium]|nr:hypothetical protein [bacterium]